MIGNCHPVDRVEGLVVRADYRGAWAHSATEPGRGLWWNEMHAGLFEERQCDFETHVMGNVYRVEADHKSSHSGIVRPGGIIWL